MYKSRTKAVQVGTGGKEPKLSFGSFPPGIEKVILSPKEGSMTGLVVFVILWVLFASGIGFALSRIEAKVNNQSPRTLNCILWVGLLGIIGIIVVAMRSSMNYAGSINKAVKTTAEKASKSDS